MLNKFDDANKHNDSDDDWVLDYDDVDPQSPKSARKQSGDSFDLVDFNKELESIDFMYDMEENRHSFAQEFHSAPRSKYFETKSSARYGVTSNMFKDIYEKPIEYWLLR